jgi:hypothetical protein
VGSGVAVGIGVGEGDAVGSALEVGAPVGDAGALAGGTLAWAIGEGLADGPGLANVVATRATTIADVATTPTTPTVTFRFNADRPFGPHHASVRPGWGSDGSAAWRRIPEVRFEGVDRLMAVGRPAR